MWRFFRLFRRQSPEYMYRTDRVRLELNQQLSDDTFSYYSWYIYVANKEVGVWDVYPISRLGDKGWQIVSINLIKQPDGSEAYYATSTIKIG